MKPEAIKKYYIKNNKVLSTDDTEIFNKIEKPSIYEVIRVIDRVPLFLEEHLNRMFDSAKIIKYDLGINKREIEKNIKKLISKNDVKNLNIKLLSTEIEEIGKVFLIYFIKSFYPPKQYYEEGIHTILFNHKRENPNAKVLITSYKDEITKEINKNKAFEALLVDDSGYIPEGSRSNLFFIKNNKVYTGGKSKVLLGITRKYIFKVCRELDIEIVENNIHKDVIEKIEGAFISGTSNNVLPIATIGDLNINSISNNIIEKINKGYIKEMEKNIINNKDKWI